MKASRFCKVFFAASIFVFGSASVATLSAQEDKNANADLSVTIRLAEKVLIEQVNNLDFGGVFVDKATASNVLMDRTGLVTSDNSILYDKDLQQLGGFRVVANALLPYSVDFPKGLDLRLSGGTTESLRYTTAVYDPTGNTFSPSPTTRVTMGATGIDLYAVAGSVVIPAAAKVGLYTANMNITVIWN